MNLRPLTDDVLIARLKGFIGEENARMADVVEHLAEVDRREFLIDRGFPSLFAYCVNELRYSEAEAFLRIRAARASRRIPRVLEDLRRGAIRLDGIARLSPHLTHENSSEILDQAAGAGKRAIQALVARFGGPEPERDVIRPVSAQTKTTTPSDTPKASSNDTDELVPAATALILAPPSRVRFSFTADDELVVVVERLRAHLRHKHPAGRLEDIFKDAAEALLVQIEREKTIVVRRSNKVSNPASRRIPKAIKVEVWNRDGGRCAYVADDGRRCESRDALEYDHVTPWAVGGRSDTADNVRLLCRPHNLRLARRRFGPRRSPPTVV